MYYFIQEQGSDKLAGYFKSEAEAVKVAKQYANLGKYTTVVCYDSLPATQKSFVFSSNEHNWLGKNGNWNTNQ